MLAGRLGVGVLIAVAGALVAASASMAPLHAQIPAPCHTRAAAQQADADCYLLRAGLVRRPGKADADASVPDLAQPPEPIVDSNVTASANAKIDQADADRHRSNQLTIIGWIGCVLLFAKGVEFALSSEFKMEQEDGPDRLRPAASVAAIGVCMAAVIFFVLLILQARQSATPAKTYGSLSECLHDAQTMDQIRECGTGDYSTGR